METFTTKLLKLLTEQRHFWVALAIYAATAAGLLYWLDGIFSETPVPGGYIDLVLWGYFALYWVAFALFVAARRLNGSDRKTGDGTP